MTYLTYADNRKTIDLAPARDVAHFNATYSQGLADERDIKQFFQKQGFKVFGATEEENMFDDIDCWIGGVSVSIKAQHSSLKYDKPTYYFETHQQLTENKKWQQTGWFHQGKAQKYAILQGRELSIIDVPTLKELIEARAATPEFKDSSGFSYTRTLSAKTRASQGGSYRFSDARCGYIYKTEVPVEKVYYL